MSARVILDCDPGIDDALAITFAHGHPGIDLIGITTVAGNVGLAQTTANALAVCEFIGAAATPVTAGCAGPLLRSALDARQVHGASGLGGARLPPPVASPAPGHAIDFIIDAARAAAGEITLAATGPLTNIALALRREPRLADWVRGFVIMGGSAGRGNVTPAAEYNIWADPEAASVVFGAGWTVIMLGLDVTLRTGTTPAVLQRMRDLGPLGTELLLPALGQHMSVGAGGVRGGRGGPRGRRGLRGTVPPQDRGDSQGGSGGMGPPGREESPPGETQPPRETGRPVHDVCAMAWIAQPELFGLVPARVQVETTGQLTSGMTVTDFEAPGAAGGGNARVATDIDVDGFWELTLGAYRRVALAMRP